MIRSNKATVGVIALALGGLPVLCAADGPDRAVAAGVKAADKAAREAAKALAKHEAADAVAAAERAVSLAPADAAYRMILGQSYLQAGRFESAGQAFADTLQLDGGNGRAALNLALTRIARGDARGARQILDAHAGDIPASDRGLALALAGDTADAVALLTQVARSPAASPKVRQNLALAYALGGQWHVARIVAAADMSPADVDQRLEQWAAFAQPRAASDQVASLLGVRPVADAGQPAALALAAPPAAAPVAVASIESVPTAVSVQIAAVSPARPKVTFAAPREVVQPLPVAVAGGAKPRAKTASRTTTRSTAPAGGKWYVQLGVFDNSNAAKDGWSRATRRYAALKGYVPRGTIFRTSKATFYRLSVGGFTRVTANEACRAYRARGGLCFVRTFAGDQLAAWLKQGGGQLAMR